MVNHFASSISLYDRRSLFISELQVSLRISNWFSNFFSSIISRFSSFCFDSRVLISAFTFPITFTIFFDPSIFRVFYSSSHIELTNLFSNPSDTKRDDEQIVLATVMHPIGKRGKSLNMCDYFVFGLIVAVAVVEMGAGGGITSPGLIVVSELGTTVAVWEIAKGILMVCFYYFSTDFVFSLSFFFFLVFLSLDLSEDDDSDVYDELDDERALFQLFFFLSYFSLSFPLYLLFFLLFFFSSDLSFSLCFFLSPMYKRFQIIIKYHHENWLSSRKIQIIKMFISKWARNSKFLLFAAFFLPLKYSKNVKVPIFCKMPMMQEPTGHIPLNTPARVILIYHMGLVFV